MRRVSCPTHTYCWPLPRYSHRLPRIGMRGYTGVVAKPHFVATGGCMYTFDLLCFCISVALYTAYNLYIRFRESSNPGYTIHGISRTARVQWVASILEKKNGILAVQTLRNATMTSTFMASTSVLLAVGVLSLTGNGENVRHTWHSLNFFSSVEPGMFAFKILALLLNFFLAFFALPHRSGFTRMWPLCLARNPGSKMQTSLAALQKNI